MRIAVLTVIALVSISLTGAVAGAPAKDTGAKVSKKKRGPRGPRGPRGFQGPQGLPGAQGPQGPAGVTGYTDVFVSGSVPNGEIVTLDATCPAGYKVSGGGFGNGANDIVYATSADDQTYEVAVGNFSTLATASASAQAFCVKGLVETGGARLATLTPAERSALIAQARLARGG